MSWLKGRMAYWQAAREPIGVSEDQTWKCRSVRFSCWRSIALIRRTGRANSMTAANGSLLKEKRRRACIELDGLTHWRRLRSYDLHSIALYSSCSAHILFYAASSRRRTCPSSAQLANLTVSEGGRGLKASWLTAPVWARL